jgi:hypothetical protein
MKAASLIAAALLPLMSVPLLASPLASSPASPPPRQAAAGTAQTATASAVVNPIAALGTARPASMAMVMREMRPVHAILMGSLDSKSAKIGSEVELRTKEPLVSADGTQIPKGSKILGHITAAEPHAKGGADARVAIQFDRVELKGGQGVRIWSEIRWVEPPPDPSTAAMMQRIDSQGNGMGGATTVQGTVKNDGVSAGNTGGMVLVNGRYQPASVLQEGLSSVATMGVQAPQQDANKGAVTEGSVTAGNRIAPHGTGVRGVMLASDASGTVSGTFSASGQNVHLDGGSQLVLGVVAIKQ